MKSSTRSKLFSNRQERGFKSTSQKQEQSDERASQLTDLANENDVDAAECAAADLFREFPPTP
jgi:hypothetical protein